ncbi:MAG TPA: UDP-N-acetylmuramate dehydrogenase [Sediminibacterium sp.]|nr:UDP-N-acetylmuramate dehydrogenase [Sediminibacterium sp.]
MQIHHNISLHPFHSFHTAVQARFFARLQSATETVLLPEVLKTYRPQSVLVLGGGSNLLFTRNWNGLVIKNEIQGIQLKTADSEHYFVEAGAGVNWHSFVLHCIEQGYAGVENLSLIPGTVGAAPIQNIGAYGVELKDVFAELTAWDMQENQVRRFTATDCCFGYRDSIFKRAWKDRFLVLRVVFRLKKHAEFHIDYGAIREELEKAGVQQPSLRSVSDAIIRIRQSKLPDPDRTGNAGSFFKNPVIPEVLQKQILAAYPDLPNYPAGEQTYKIPAGWLIEQAGWRGYREGDAGCYNKQALVLVNYGKATGSQIADLAFRIQNSVQQKFGIRLEPEVNIL